jgi:hypothetical protein
VVAGPSRARTTARLDHKCKRACRTSCGPPSL